MKLSTSIIASAVVATLSLATFAGEKGKTAASSQFSALDTDRDGRLSPAEAANDTKIVFSTADKNGDGYLDNDEYMHLNRTTETMPTHPATDAGSPPK